MQDFDDVLFPGLSVGAQGHGGFLGQHAKTAQTIFPEVKRLISAKGATNVITVRRILTGNSTVVSNCVNRSDILSEEPWLN